MLSPYQPGGGPYFLTAKLSRLADVAMGDMAPFPLAQQTPGSYPNSGNDVFGSSATHRLRLYYSGGMTVNGITGLQPQLMWDYFALLLEDGTLVGDQATADALGLGALGLADTGTFVPPATVGELDMCYLDDRDNYIDLAFAPQSEEVVRRVRQVRGVPAAGRTHVVQPGRARADACGVHVHERCVPQNVTVMDATQDPNVVTVLL